nr:Retrovirus-related Pol polyprotein from transposon TNT 1-94 [Ipomoea batatas]
MHAVYIINRLPSPVIECSSPYQRLYGEVPDISNLKVFGCLCYAATLSGNKHKMAPRGRKCLFIGIPAGMKGYMLYDLGDGSIFVSRDVTFYEEEFPMAADISQSHSQQGPPLPNIPTHHELELYEQQQPPNQPRHVEQTSTEQQGSVHEQPHGNITPSTDLVESQQVQNSEPTSTSQPDVTDQEGIDDSRQPTRDDQAKGMQMDQCQATDKLQTESMKSLAFTQLQIRQMAYAAVTSLMGTLSQHFLQPQPRLPLQYKKQILSLHQNLGFLQEVLEKSEIAYAYDNSAMKDLEAQIRDVACKAED